MGLCDLTILVSGKANLFMPISITMRQRQFAQKGLCEVGPEEITLDSIPSEKNTSFLAKRDSKQCMPGFFVDLGTTV